jgi:hypothetical protein
MKDSEGREFHLTMDASQAKEIKRKLEDFICADEAFSKIQKKDVREMNSLEVKE